MRCSLRQLAVVTSALALIFFCSCERHHPDELPVEEHGKAAPGQHEHKAKPGHEHTSASPTPAEFFPTSTPR